MYKGLYSKADMLAERIRRGNTSKTRKDPAQGFFPRRTLEEMIDRTEEPLDVIGRYLADIRNGSEELRERIREGQPDPNMPTGQDLLDEIDRRMSLGTEGRERSEPTRFGGVINGSRSTAGEDTWDYSSISDFADRMMSSESSGRSDVQITTTSGGREQTMTGLFQFSEDRLQDYMNNTGASFSVEEFRNDEDLQKDVFAWHIQDIDRLIDNNNLVEQGYSRDGLRAVAHLGGRTGMLNWVRSGGRDNPSDKFGTDLSFYYNKFGG